MNLNFRISKHLKKTDDVMDWDGALDFDRKSIKKSCKMEFCVATSHTWTPVSNPEISL